MFAVNDHHIADEDKELVLNLNRLYSFQETICLLI